MKSLHKLLVFFLFTSFYAPVLGQNVQISRNLWSAAGESDLPTAGRQIIPNSYAVLHLDVAAMQQQLLAAPDETDVLNHAVEPLVMEFPNPAGGFSRYKIWYFSPMSPELQAQFPEIRSYAGIGIDDPYAHVFFDVTPQGFHAMTLRSKEGSVFIDPYAQNDREHYLVYYRKDFSRSPENRLTCLVSDTTAVKPFDAPETANCGKRREYRLALACTGEYAIFHGGTVPLALAAINTAMTRVNGVFVTEVSIKMNLIANNASIVYTNPATDPYTNNDGFLMLDENQANIDAVIGNANYDIGHVFSTGGGGVALLGSPCFTGYKAQGVTGLPAPIGDPFYIDYVCHEMGHQYGAPHCFSSSAGACDAVNNASTAFEPGSGSTIMAYAGICDPENVQNNSDAYFHATSLLSISNFVTPAGHTCDNEISISNSKPVVAALTNVNFPKSTPFVLNGTATDPNGDPITYCWEQYNAAAVSPPAGSNTSGPLFRSLTPVTASNRYFPSFDNVFGNSVDPWEVLPAVARTLTFRLTARDNVAAGGCTDEKNMDVVISGTAGPFVVTAPNGGESIQATTNTTVTWNVAGTSASPVSCANVDILYSTNPSDPTSYTVLLANTPNDGSQVVTMPNTVSTTVRIMVRCSNTTGSYFFDISNANFSITTPPLPVQLVEFNAVRQQSKASLTWVTASERSSNGFGIERRSAHRTEFENIGFVPSDRSTAAKHFYTFTDWPAADGIFYYRLRQEDTDGAIAYSQVQSVDFGNSGAKLFVTPNPARTDFILSFETPGKDNTFTVNILSNDGRLMLSRVMQIGQPVEIENWPDGVYTIQAMNDRQVFTAKVVKI